MSSLGLLEKAAAADEAKDYAGAFELGSQAAESALKERNEYYFDLAFHRVVAHAARLRDANAARTLSARTWPAPDTLLASSQPLATLSMSCQEALRHGAKGSAVPGAVFATCRPRPSLVPWLLVASILFVLLALPAALGATELLALPGAIAAIALGIRAYAWWRDRAAVIAVFPHMIVELDREGLVHFVPLAGKRTFTLTETRDSATLRYIGLVAMFGASQAMAYATGFSFGRQITPNNLSYILRMDTVARAVDMRILGLDKGELTLLFDQVRTFMIECVRSRDPARFLALGVVGAGAS